MICPHHVMWIQFRPGGKFWCLQCHSYVSRKDVYPKIEDLGPEFVRQWEEHEKGRHGDGSAASVASRREDVLRPCRRRIQSNAPSARATLPRASWGCGTGYSGRSRVPVTAAPKRTARSAAARCVTAAGRSMALIHGAGPGRPS
jgi:hypothetical protein